MTIENEQLHAQDSKLTPHHHHIQHNTTHIKLNLKLNTDSTKTEYKHTQ